MRVRMPFQGRYERFRKLQRDIQREISPQERKQPEQDRPVR